MKRVLAVLCTLGLVFLAGCATSPTGRQQLMLVSDSQMNQLGLDSFDQMRQQGQFANAPREKAYATCIAQALVKVLPEPWGGEDWQVEIIKDDTANAFALPGGRIGVNQGMFKVADNQDLLAVVMSHELSHVVARHGAERVSDNLAVQTGVAAAGAIGASRGMNPDMLMAALGVGSQVGILLPFSRTQESEADMLGQQYMARAGFNPSAAVTLWERMGAGSSSRDASFLSTHPAPGQRAQRLGEAAKQLMPVYTAARAEGRAPNCRM